MQINYYSENYLKFEKDFINLYTGLAPVSTITDDLERAMSKDKPYFILPAQVARDGVQHVFYFEVMRDRYEYKNHT